MDDRLSQALLRIELNDFEQHTVWRDFSPQAQEWRRKQDTTQLTTWESHSSGFRVQVGAMGKKPIWLSISFATLDGVLVMFYHPTSKVVDYDQIDAWLDEHLPQTKGKMGHDAMNFCNFVHEVIEVAKTMPAHARLAVEACA